MLRSPGEYRLLQCSPACHESGHEREQMRWCRGFGVYEFDGMDQELIEEDREKTMVMDKKDIGDEGEALSGWVVITQNTSTQNATFTTGQRQSATFYQKQTLRGKTTE